MNSRRAKRRLEPSLDRKAFSLAGIHWLRQDRFSCSAEWICLPNRLVTDQAMLSIREVNNTDGFGLSNLQSTCIIAYWTISGTANPHACTKVCVPLSPTSNAVPISLNRGEVPRLLRTNPRTIHPIQLSMVDNAAAIPNRPLRWRPGTA